MHSTMWPEHSSGLANGCRLTWQVCTVPYEQRGSELSLSTLLSITMDFTYGMHTAIHASSSNELLLTAADIVLQA